MDIRDQKVIPTSNLSRMKQSIGSSEDSTTDIAKRGDFVYLVWHHLWKRVEGGLFRLASYPNLGSKLDRT